MPDRWKDVPYPQWWLARAAARKDALAAAVSRLRERLPFVRGARGALVFGSYATGRVGPTSDLDVIVVVDDVGDASWIDRSARVARELDLRVPCDLIVYEAGQYEDLKSTRNFVAAAAAEGLWIDAATPG
jgi:predicted nucleotidyltransferase